MTTRIHLVARPFLVGAEDTARILGISRSSLDRFDRSGRLGPQAVRLGTRRLFRVDELARWIESGLPPRERWLAALQYTPAPAGGPRALPSSDNPYNERAIDDS